MADSSILTYEQDPARRPSLDDLDGGQCTNDAEFPPVPGVDPDANAMNQRDKLVVGLAAMVGAAWVHVTITAGTPAITALGGMRQGGNALVAGDFSLVDNGSGDISVTHAGGLLPPMTWPPFAVIVGSTAGSIACESITNGARVRMSADLNFVVFLSGV